MMLILAYDSYFLKKKTLKWFLSKRPKRLSATKNHDSYKEMSVGTYNFYCRFYGENMLKYYILAACSLLQQILSSSICLQDTMMSKGANKVLDEKTLGAKDTQLNFGMKMCSQKFLI